MNGGVVVGQLEIRADQRAATAKNEKLGEMFVFASKKVKCTRCGIVPRNPDTFFYKRQSYTYSAQDNRICVCKECANKIYDEFFELYQDPFVSMQLFCSEFNYYYNSDVVQNLIDNKKLSVGTYIASVGRTYKDKTFYDTYKELVAKKSSVQIQEEKEESTIKRIKKWTIEDRKNRDNVIALVGYDPFTDDEYTEEQLRFLYNTSAGYLTEAVEQDPHKLQNIIMMVKTFLQLETVDKLINKQFNSPVPDANLIGTFTTMKDKLNSSAIKIANENGFSEKTSGKSMQGSNTLSARMQKMYDANFELSKVNIHDVRMAESFREISSMNAHALIEEMNLTGDDYARLCADQRTFVSELQETNEEIEEENRLLRIKIKDLESQLKSFKKKK